MNLARILWWLDLLMLIAGGLIAAGMLAVWIPRRRDLLRGTPLRPNRLSVVSVWLCITAYFVGALAGSTVGRRLAAAIADEKQRDVWISIPASSLGGALAVICCLTVARHAFTGGWRGLGLTRRPFARDLLAALPAWLASVSVCSAVAWLTQKLVVLVRPAFTPPDHGVFTAFDDPLMPAAMKAIAFAGALCIAPLAEELLFRGILQTAAARLFPLTRAHLHRWGSIALVAVLFGAMHSTTPHHIPALILFGVILGYLYERTGSLVLPILVHFLFNGKSLVWYLILPRVPLSG